MPRFSQEQIPRICAALGQVLPFFFLGFADQGGISAYAVKPMQWAVAQELIFGVGGNALAPKATATRAQLAAVLHRFCEAFA